MSGDTSWVCGNCGDSIELDRNGNCSGCGSTSCVPDNPRRVSHATGIERESAHFNGERTRRLIRGINQ